MTLRYFLLGIFLLGFGILTISDRSPVYAQDSQDECRDDSVGVWPCTDYSLDGVEIDKSFPSEGLTDDGWLDESRSLDYESFHHFSGRYTDGDLVDKDGDRDLTIPDIGGTCFTGFKKDIDGNCVKCFNGEFFHNSRKTCRPILSCSIGQYFDQNSETCKETVCSADRVKVNGYCVCPAGSISKNGYIRSDSRPHAYYVRNFCVPEICPAGTYRNGILCHTEAEYCPFWSRNLPSWFLKKSSDYFDRLHDGRLTTHACPKKRSCPGRHYIEATNICGDCLLDNHVWDSDSNGCVVEDQSGDNRCSGLRVDDPVGDLTNYQEVFFCPETFNWKSHHGRPAIVNDSGNLWGHCVGRYYKARLSLPKVRDRLILQISRNANYTFPEDDEIYLEHYNLIPPFWYHDRSCIRAVKTGSWAAENLIVNPGCTKRGC